MTDGETNEQKKKLKQKPHTKFHSIVMNVQGSSYITRFHFYTYKKQYRKKVKQNQKSSQPAQVKKLPFCLCKLRKKLRRRLLADLSCLFVRKSKRDGCHKGARGQTKFSHL